MTVVSSTPQKTPHKFHSPSQPEKPQSRKNSDTLSPIPKKILRKEESLKVKELKSLIKEKDAEIKKLNKTVEQLEKQKKEDSLVIYACINEDQRKAILSGRTRGRAWSDETYKKSLSLRLACGSSGYKSLLNLTGAPYPAIRTLQNRIKDIKFDPGVLLVVFMYLSVIVPLMPALMLPCALVFDEMALQPGVQFDPSTGGYIGKATLPGSEMKNATKALVFQLVGLGNRWKQYVAYHLVPPHAMNEAVKDVILDILRCAEVGLKVRLLICDMGNRGLLTLLGFLFTKNGMVYRIPHPFEPGEELIMMPDPVHVFKNAKDMAIENEYLVLPQDIVDLYGLPTAVADFNHVEMLDKYQQLNCEELKFCPKLKKKDIHPTHFDKMKVKTTTNVIDFGVAAGLTYLAEALNIPAMQTTAFVIRLLRAWFNQMTGRTLVHAFSFHNRVAYQEAVDLLKTVKDIFLRSTVGVSGAWKVSQTHVVMSTDAMLTIQDTLLNKEGFQFFFPGRANQDNVESGYANIRRGTPKPTSLLFKFRFKMLCLVGQDQEIIESSYAFDGAPSLIDLLLKSARSPEEVEVSVLSFNLPLLSQCAELSVDVQKILYRMCGYVLLTLQKRLKCQGCLQALKDTPRPRVPSSLSHWVDMTDYVPGAQIRVSLEFFQLCSAMERIMWKVADKLTGMGESLHTKFVDHFSRNLSDFQLNTCHDIRKEVISRYVSMRLRQLSLNITAATTDKVGAVYASRTMGASHLADQLRINYTR